PAHTVVDSQAMKVVLDDSDAGIASVSAAVGFLSAPPGDPVPDALPGGTAGTADGTEGRGDMNGAAVLAGTAGSTRCPVTATATAVPATVAGISAPAVNQPIRQNVPRM